MRSESDDRSPVAAAPDRDRVFRVLDANLNRLREALRVLEDYCRLVCDDPEALNLKELRHRLQSLVETGDLHSRCLAGRRAASDVGSRSFTASEATRRDWPALLKANCKRAQEAARTLEEVGKLLPDVADFSFRVKSLRFELYELEARLLGGRRRKVREWFALDEDASGRKRTAFYLVVDEKFYSGYDLLADLEEVLKVGVDILQWRCKSGSDRDFLRKARKIRELCRRFETPFVVNDRPDIALLVEADGLHLGQDDLPLAEARRLVGPGMVIGRSTHSLEQALKADAEGADYLGFGPIFTTPSKANPDPTVGIDGLVEMLARVSRPVVAIGGLDENNLETVVSRSRVPAVAVIRAVLAADHPASQTARLNKLLARQ
ncbi:MAG: thiamine phosphate synthase [Deltaproteobacteria bacterium]|nr:thiamine phosphate synthase [Deltaproteobacteria bacterium]